LIAAVIDHDQVPMIFSESRLPPRIKPAAGFFGIML
jgi:hypothetical protein